MYPQCKLCSADDRRDFPGAALGPVFDMPVILQRHLTCTVLECQGRRHLRRGADAVSYGPDCSEKHRDSPVAVHLIRWSTSLFGRCPADSSGAVCEKTAEISQLHSSYSCLDKVVHTPAVCNDSCRWFSVQKTAKVPQLHCSDKVVDVPVQRQVWVSTTVEVPQIQFTPRVKLVDIPVVQQRLVRSF